MAASVVIEMSGKEARLVRAFQAVVAQQAKVEAGFKKAGAAAGHAHDKTQEGTQKSHHGMSGLKGAIMEVGMAFGTWKLAEGIFRTLTSFASEAQEEIKGVAEALKESYEKMKFIWQVSDSVEMYGALSEQVKTAMIKEGLTREEALDLTFTMKSARQEEHIPVLATAKRYMDPAIAGKFFTAVTAPSLWGPEAGTPQQILSMLVEGAKESKFTQEETATEFMRRAAAFRAMGAKPEEILAVQAATSQAFPNVHLAATGMRALESQLTQWRETAIDVGITDKATGKVTKLRPEDRGGIMQTLEQYRTMDPEGYKQRKLAEVRFKDIADALEGAIDEVPRLQGVIEEAFKTGGAYYQRIGVRPEELTRLERAEKAEAQKQVLMEPLAAAQMELETGIKTLTGLYAAAGKPITMAKAWEKAAQTGATVGMVEESTEQVYQQIADTIMQKYPSVFKREIEPHFKKGTRYVMGTEGFGGGAFPFTDVPERMTEAQKEAFDRAMEAIGVESLRRRNEPPAPVLPPPSGPRWPTLGEVLFDELPSRMNRRMPWYGMASDLEKRFSAPGEEPAGRGQAAPTSEPGSPAFLPGEQPAVDEFRKATKDFADASQNLKRFGDRAKNSTAGLGSPLKDQ